MVKALFIVIILYIYNYAESIYVMWCNVILLIKNRELVKPDISVQVGKQKILMQMKGSCDSLHTSKLATSWDSINSYSNLQLDLVTLLFLNKTVKITK